jgi:chemotaxis protein methyltransferase CheR
MESLHTGALKLEEREFRALADVLQESAGLAFTESSRIVFERRLADRVVELGLATFSEYHKYLLYSTNRESELSAALELLTTAETYFMRQAYQLESFRSEVLPELLRRNEQTRRLTVWSAGCSTGEEVFTLAILIRDSELFQGWEVRVLGSDLTSSRVATARRGIYRERSFKAVDASFRDRHFSPHPEGWQIADSIRAMCHFGQLNLMDAGSVSSVGRVDVVFCRNVLIYFAPAQRAIVTQHLYQRLVRGGYLFLGHSESLLNVSTAFELVHLKEDLVYRKPRIGQRDSGQTP